MEDKSLPLVEKSQHAATILDEMKTKLDALRIDHERETGELQREIDQLNQSVERAKQRELSCRSLLE